MKIIAIDPTGAEHVLDAIEGYSVMEIIRDAGLPIRAECGGCCACATCHVYVDPASAARVPAASPDEIDMLDLAFDVNEASRLSCQILMTPALDGLRVKLAPGSI